MNAIKKLFSNIMLTLIPEWAGY